MGCIVVTGGLGAFGRSIVRTVSKSHKVVVLDSVQGEAEGATSVRGGLDLTVPSSVEDVFAEIAQNFATIDGVVNAAGGFVWDTLADGDTANWERMFRTNLLSAVNTLRAAYPYLRKPGASIVNVGAAAALQASSGMGSYVASKAGIAALTEAISSEWAPVGIRANSILPTILDTPSNRAAMGDANTSEWVSTDDAAKVVGFLLSADSAAVTGAAIKLAMPPIAHHKT